MQNIAENVSSYRQILGNIEHGLALEGSDPHELAPRFEVCQMKGMQCIQGLQN